MEEKIGIMFAKTFAILSIIAFPLNLVWEFFQMPLYVTPANYPWCCIWASIGDVIIIFTIYALIAIANKNKYWIHKLNVRYMSTVVFLGIGIAIFIEIAALSTARWQYAPAMPVLTYFNIGLTPVLQMALLPLATFYLTHKISEKLETNKILR